MENPSLIGDFALLENALSQGNKQKILQLLQQQNINVKTVNEVGDTVLHLTLRNSKLFENEIIEILEIFIDRGVDPNVKNKEQETVLHLALTTWNRRIVDCLLKHNAKIDVTDEHGNSILHNFFKNTAYKLNSRLFYRSSKIKIEDERESADFVEWLLFKGFDIDCQNDKGQSALHLAIEYNLQHILPALLRHTRDINFISEQNNETLLQLFLKAISYENPSYYPGVNYSMDPRMLQCKVESSAFSWRYDNEIVKIFLERGISVEHEDKEGRTALQLAVDIAQTKADMDIVQLLFDRSSEVQGERGHSLLHSVIKKVNFKDPDSDQLYFKILSTLITKGRNLLNNTDKDGLTPLYHAVKYSNMRAIDLMRENGANFSVITNLDSNLFHALAGNNLDNRCKSNVRYQEDFIDFLVSQGCNVNQKDREGKTPLHIAVDNQNMTVIRKLCAHGADVNCHRDERQESTLLHLAISALNPSVDVIKLLLDNGANVNAKSGLDRSRPIHLAANFDISNSEIILKMLLERGVEVNARDYKNDTALVPALLSLGTNNVEELLKHGADINESCVIRKLPYCCQGPPGDLLLQHWIKLKTANLACSNEFGTYVGSEAHQMSFQICLREIDQLKIMKIDSHLSLYQWLHMDSNRRYLYCLNEKLRALVESPTLLEKFPAYSTVIIGYYRETEARRRLLEPAKEALIKLIKFHLPDICLELILVNLNTGYLLDIIELAQENN